jgi:hypothetical protein
LKHEKLAARSFKPLHSEHFPELNEAINAENLNISPS